MKKNHFKGASAVLIISTKGVLHYLTTKPGCKYQPVLIINENIQCVLLLNSNIIRKVRGWLVELQKEFFLMDFELLTFPCT